MYGSLSIAIQAALVATLTTASFCLPPCPFALPAASTVCLHNCHRLSSPHPTLQVAVKVLQRIDPKLLHGASAGLGSKITRSGIIAEQALQELAKVREGA